MKLRLGMNDGSVRRYIEAKKKQIPRLIRMFGVEFYRQVTISTPVDTGRARYGWNCSIGSPDFSIPAAAPNNWIGESAGGQAFYKIDTERAANTFTSGNVTEFSTIYISNAVPYVEILNEGHSRQAPARFVELAFANTVEKMKVYLKVK